MHVAVRVRPLSQKETESVSCCCDVVSEGHVAITKRAANGAFLKSQAGAVHEYAFDSVFGFEATQMDVYERTTRRYAPLDQRVNGGRWLISTSVNLAHSTVLSMI